MSDRPGILGYEEQREYSLLERSLLAKRLDLPACLTILASVLAIGLALFHIFVAGFGTPETLSFRSTHVSVMFILALLTYPTFRGSILQPIIVPGDRGNPKRVVGFLVDLCLIAMIVSIQVYLLRDIEGFQERENALIESDVVFGWMLVGLVLEMTRRVVGWTMVLITGFFIIQTLHAPHFIGMFYGPGVSGEDFIDVQFVQPSMGIFGIPVLVASTYIVLFIVFSGVLIRSGAGRFFIELAVSLTGHRIGGPAKASVVASAFLGTVSGSSTANVVTTGSFTIPMMKRLGYRARFAAAVEACASSGGQITPPIMGAAAFIIAEFLRVSYLWVVIAAIVPTLLYFATVYFMVHLEAEKHGIEKLPREELPRLWDVLKDGWHLLFSLVVLVALLSYGFTATLAAFWAIITLSALTFINPHTRMSPVDFLSAIESGVRSTIPVTVACACAGIIIGSIFVTGLGLKFTHSVISLSGGYLFVMLVLTGVAAIILGMGVTTTAVYITVAALIVPALIQIGVVPIAAHLFAFYYGVVSSITPPVALTAFAGAAIAGSPPMATAFEAARIGVAKYVVPFVFVYNPSLLFEGPLWLTGYSTITAFVGVWGVSLALEGWYRGALSLPSRVLAGGAAILLVYPPMVSPFGVSGFALNGVGALGLVALHAVRSRADRAAVIARSSAE